MAAPAPRGRMTPLSDGDRPPAITEITKWRRLGRRRSDRRKLDGEQEARLVALACSPPPLGRRFWTLRLLADRLLELRFVDGISHETVRRLLKKNALKPR